MTKKIFKYPLSQDDRVTKFSIECHSFLPITIEQQGDQLVLYAEVYPAGDQYWNYEVEVIGLMTGEECPGEMCYLKTFMGPLVYHYYYRITCTIPEMDKLQSS